ncbi:uncharacterized protein LOC132921475 [Rhopalosiphum padi]|uniref:uncharacterized protein LOC132921475 n=1 Tax=Rhopalosiphum padi TaxID=40932 RepID=UPI00298E8646|nr:uncharacterized protein LOC132921475 [Rhopalosiphum padi]
MLKLLFNNTKYIYLDISSELTMKVMFSWSIYMCFIFGTGILCQYKKQDGSTCYDKQSYSFKCPKSDDRECLLWSQLCDGRDDCSDGSDENKELCNRYEYGINNKNVCGKLYSSNHTLLANGKKAHVGTVPWTVGIYRLNGNTSRYDLICGGSLIAPNLVVSVAHCFWYKGILSKQISIKDNSYKVAIGKYDKNFTVIENENTIKMDVNMIYINEAYEGSKYKYAYDIAVIVLSNGVYFNNVVSPICIDWHNQYHEPNGNNGKIFEWKNIENGKPNSVLLETSLPFIDRPACRKIYTDGFDIFVTDDKFCAGSKLVYGEDLDETDSGLGLMYSHSQSYYLTGVLSLKQLSTNNSIALFTDIKYHLKWIRALNNKHRDYDTTFCVLPAVEGVLYSYVGSNEILAHGTIIKQDITVHENCDVGYHKAYPNGFRVCQGNGKWISISEKLCLKMCPPLLSESLDIKCSLNGKFTNCSNPSITDTIAIPSCKPTYITPIGLEDTPFELICQSNGMWSNKLYKCKPYCGKIYTDGKILIANGTKALFGSAPWNVGIYRLNKDTSNYDLICGGSIIAPNLVVSAAHCFWYKGISSKKISINDGSYKVAVGKYDRDITIIDNDFTRIMDVDIIYLHERFTGTHTYFAYDIAVMVLSNLVSFSNVVAPICIDWKSRYDLLNGVEGKIVGWGKTENGKLSSVLLETSLPYIDHNSCRDMYTNGFQIFLTVDKFCAGSALVSGQGLGEGDSGSGLAYLHSMSYYLTGVLSLKEPNSNNSIAVFTDVKYHVQWIRELHNRHNEV